MGKEELVRFVKEDLLDNMYEELDGSTPIFKKGYIDSFGLLDLISYIEEEYGVRVEDYEIADMNIETLDQLYDVIEERRNNG